MIFSEKLEEIFNKFEREIIKKNNSPIENISFEDKLKYGIELWCTELKFDGNITNYILKGYDELPYVQEIIRFVWKESIQNKKKIKIQFLEREFDVQNLPNVFEIENEFHRYINSFLNKILISNKKREFIQLVVILAFGVTAVGSCLYKLKEQTETQQTKEFILSQEQTINKKFLVLVTFNPETDFLVSLQDKKCIELNNAEKLYKITRYLWLGSENDFNRQKQNLDNSLGNYSIKKGEESNFDINLVYIELKEGHEGFQQNANQLDRHDAFRKLPDLATNFKISEKFKMKAYENFQVYNR